ncbi:MAG: NfeD family protein [Burkholderiales bacterium]
MAAPGPAVVLSINGPIGPATADYFHRGLEHASSLSAQIVVLQMDTPGGLDVSMRLIIKDMLAAPVPVAAFVAPRGARAASAGTYILYASHIAAMAPATNLGAATPVTIGGMSVTSRVLTALAATEEKKNENDATVEKDPNRQTLARKQVHDAAAYIRGLAQLRGRNKEWAEKAVREAVSLSSEDALKTSVIDLVADDVPQLLQQLNRHKVNVLGQERTLDTVKITVIPFEPDWRDRLLTAITDPGLAYILMLIGIYGLFFEFSHPGFILPGVAGVICLLLALFAFQLLPVNYAGLLLMFLGIAFIIAETFFPAYGSLGAGGIIAFVIGSVMLIDAPGFGIPWPLIMGVTLVTALFLFFVAGMALKARRRPVVSGQEEMVGSVGEALEDFEREGWARIHGETWRVSSEAPVTRGQKVRVVRMDSLVLNVAPESARQRGE